MADGERPDAATQAALAAVLQAIKDMEQSNRSANQQLERAFDDKLDGLRKEVTDKQEAACAKISQKIKEKEKVQFKRKGNELQYAFNEEVKGKFGELADLLEGGDDGSQRAKEVVKEGMELLENRQKLIRRSDMGWKTADEYEKDPVARDSDDEKRIKKAEAAAEKRAAKDRQKKSNRFRSFRRGKYPVYTATKDVGPWRRSWSAGNTAASGPMPRRMPSRRAPCWRCNSEFHWAKDCPEVQSASGYQVGASPGSYTGRRQ